MGTEKNVRRESELYEPMRLWLDTYLKDKYKNSTVITVDSHNERLDRILNKHGIIYNVATGINIQIDVLGIVIKSNTVKLFFIEAKKTNLTLHDLGQLWAYCKLIAPEEAFLMSPLGLGSLERILTTFGREDLLDFGDKKKIKKMKVAVWNLSTNSPEYSTMIPKLD